MGQELPLTLEAFISLFVVSFGGALLTEDTSKAFKAFRRACNDSVKT